MRCLSEVFVIVFVRVLDYTMICPSNKSHADTITIKFFMVEHLCVFEYEYEYHPFGAEYAYEYFGSSTQILDV